MSDPYNPYGHYHGVHQVKAEITGNGSTQEFAYSVGYGKGPGGRGAPADPASSSSHLSSLNDCVNRLQTSLNQYLTKIIDEGSEGPSNYNLGSGEVLNSHLMEQYSSGGQSSTPPMSHHDAQPPSGPRHANTAAAFGAQPPPGLDPGAHNGYSYYSNYPQNYGYHHPHAAPPPHGGHHQPYGMPPDYSHQYQEFQEPKPKKQKSK